jgi:hypothetical protein
MRLLIVRPEPGASATAVRVRALAAELLGRAGPGLRALFTP